MDPIWWIIVAWVAISVICYYFVVCRRSAGPKVPEIKIDDGNAIVSAEAQKSFANDLLNWLVWGVSGPLGAEQRQALSPVLNKFVLNALNEAAERLHNKEQIPEVQFECLSRTSSLGTSMDPIFRNMYVHSNNSPGNYLSIHAQMSYVSQGNESDANGIRLEISVPTKEGQQNANNIRMRSAQMPKVSTVMAVKRHTIIVEQLQGDIETRLATIAGELFIITCFKDRPRLHLKLAENDKTPNSEQILNAVKRCIVGAVLNFSVGELLYPDTADARARASRARLSAEYRNLSFLHEMYPGPGTELQKKTSSRSISPKFPVIDEDTFVRPEELAAANRLNIQLIKIHGVNFGADRPFVCIELDEPSQRFLSIKSHEIIGNGEGAQWDPNKAIFEFAVSPNSNEVLFEVFAEDKNVQQQQNAINNHNANSNTVRERKFCGTAILSVAELRQAVLEGRAACIELRLHGRPFGYGGDADAGVKRRHGNGTQQKDAYGVLMIKASFHTRHEIARPSAPQPTEMGALEYAKLIRQQQQKSPSPFAYPGPGASAPASLTQKQSTTTVESTTTVTTRSSTSPLKRGLSRHQKKHYIYNVNDDGGSGSDTTGQQPPFSPYDRQYATTASSSSPEPRKTSLLQKPAFDYSAAAAYPYPTNGHTALRKTISDTNAALFQFNGQRIQYAQDRDDTVAAPERKKSAPDQQQEQRHVEIRSVDNIRRRDSNAKPKQDELQNNVEVLQQNGGDKSPTTPERQIQIENQDPYEQLFEKEKERHPAMGIFEMPDKLKRIAVGDDPREFERVARESERRTGRPKKRERSFFEKVRARLAGPVRLLPGGKRAKSYDDYESRRMEEAQSVPASRDQSQTRWGQQQVRKGSQQLEQAQQQQQLFVSTTSDQQSSTAGSTVMLHSPKTGLDQSQHAPTHLILELIGPEEERPRYYSIPPEVEAEPAVVKLMQSGKKLHIHEGHIFVAVKPRGRVICAICDKKIGSNFSTRQAYQCRDCRMACHKSCHLRTSWVCTASSIFNMQIEEVDWPEFLRHNQLREFISSVGL